MAIAPAVDLGGPVENLIFNLSGSRALARTREGIVHVYDSRTGTPCHANLCHGADMKDMRLVKDDDSLLTWGEKFLRGWDLQTGKDLFPPVTFPAPLSGAAFPRDYPELVVIWAEHGVAKAFNTSTGQAESRLYVHGPSMAGVTVSRDRLLTWDRGGRIRELRFPVHLTLCLWPNRGSEWSALMIP